jgi:hypothetical protein
MVIKNSALKESGLTAAIVYAQQLGVGAQLAAAFSPSWSSGRVMMSSACCLFCMNGSGSSTWLLLVAFNVNIAGLPNQDADLSQDADSIHSACSTCACFCLHVVPASTSARPLATASLVGHLTISSSVLSIAAQILCMHGGLSPELKSLEQIKRVARPTDVPDSGLLCDLLWADPDKDIQVSSCCSLQEQRALSWADVI